MATNTLQAFLNAGGVWALPIPTTSIPDSRRRVANLVKSESDDTMQNPRTLPLCRMSMASMISALSVAFFPETAVNC